MTFDADLLSLARTLLRRRTGQRGQLSRARIRRSISTSYYALFHFISANVTQTIVGTRNSFRPRRRILARNLTHAGLKSALDKVRGGQIDASIQDFLILAPGSGHMQTPVFVRELANVFADAQAKRHDADYDLNRVLSETDARVMHVRVRRAIRKWKAASSRHDRDFKRALCILMLMRGQLRSQ